MMNTLRRSQRALLALLLSFSVSLSAQAAFSDVYFFGDSLSDTGNLFTASGGTVPPSPYYNGGFSDGPLWVNHLAGGLGLSGAASSFQSGGNNYAWAGAMSGTAGLSDPQLGIPTGLQTQVAAYWAETHPFADPNALYVITIGGNDLAEIAENLPGANDAAARLAQAQEVVDNLLFSVNFLIDHGAHNFLIANAPDIGITPEAIFGGFAAAASDVSVQYNALLAAALDSLADRANIISLDLFGLLNTLVDDANAGGGTYGFDNASIPCIGLDTCDRSIFFDDFHPTGAVHALAGQLALASVVPEPASVSLLLAGLLTAAGFAKRRSLTTAPPASKTNPVSYSILQ